MASSTTWAAGGGLAVVTAALLGAAAWTRLHPDSPSPLAALEPVVTHSTPAPSAPSPSEAPVAPAGASRTRADRGPEPPTAPNPDANADGGAPTFDVVRVEPSGDAVVAGKGRPDSRVALLASGKIVAEAKTDASGQFVMTPPPLKPGAYDLSLQQQSPGHAAQESRQAVAVSVPDQGKGQVVVALAEPGKPTRVLAAPVAALPPVVAPTAAGKPEATGKDSAVKLAVRSVELENGTGFYATGTAPAGAQLRVYLNDSHLADLTPGADGGWTLRIHKGLTGGRYTVRVDALEAGASKVASRVEVPFDVPAAVARGAPGGPRAAPASATTAALAPTSSAEAPAPPRSPNPDAAVPAKVAGAGASGAAAPSADAVVDSIETALVAPGDNLWNISRVRLGDGIRYTRIYTANANQIRNPDLIYPGQVFVVPKD